MTKIGLSTLGILTLTEKKKLCGSTNKHVLYHNGKNLLWEEYMSNNFAIYF